MRVAGGASGQVDRREAISLAGAAVVFMAASAQAGATPSTERATKMKMVCIIRYQIDPFQKEAFQVVRRRRLGKDHSSLRVVICWATSCPGKAPTTWPWGMIGFESLKPLMRATRALLRADAEGMANFEFAQSRRLILREERNCVEDRSIRRHVRNTGHGGSHAVIKGYQDRKSGSPQLAIARYFFAISACAVFVLIRLAFERRAIRKTNPGRSPFSEYTPLSNNLEMARRLLSPLTAARIPEQLAATGKSLADQPIDLANERFRIYVPRTAPAAGYGVLVFIPPWDDDHIPPGWTDILESRGVIFVSGGRTGNDATSLGRREPLALLAAYNVMRRYKVDPRRVYICGFSGGSRVALRPVGDLFSSALLDAGADPLGEADFPLPPRI